MVGFNSVHYLKYFSYGWIEFSAKQWKLVDFFSLKQLKTLLFATREFLILLTWITQSYFQFRQEAGRRFRTQEAPQKEEPKIILLSRDLASVLTSVLLPSLHLLQLFLANTSVKEWAFRKKSKTILNFAFVYVYTLISTLTNPAIHQSFSHLPLMTREGFKNISSVN